MTAMSFRTRLLLLLSATVLGTVALVTWAASESAARSFDTLDAQRTAALVAQFRAEFARRGAEVAERAESIATSGEVLQAAVEANRPQPDYARFFSLAERLAATQRLPLVELLTADGTIISSAQWPARFGYRKEGFRAETEKTGMAVLTREALPDGQTLALLGKRPVTVGEATVWVLAGRPLNQQFLDTLVLPEGMRVLLVTASGADGAASGGVPKDDLAALLAQLRRGALLASRTVNAKGQEEQFTAIALHAGAGEFSRGELLGALLVGSSRAERNAMLARLRREGALFAGAGFLLALALSLWLSRRVTRPLEELAAGARAVSAGQWETRVRVHSRDEVGQLAEDFNRMTAQLAEQRDRLVQSERVAAWRELARRLAHELKNPLFPLQITVENLQRARALAAEGSSAQATTQATAQFEEVFEESTTTLLAELANLKTIIGRFSDFARMPPPEMQRVEVNELVKESVRLFDAQFAANPEAPIRATLALDDAAGSIDADPELLRRALRNLLLNAIDAMPEGGEIQVASRREDESVLLSVTDTGTGIAPEEAARLFTPYYTTRRHGTGLGLAIVQSVVADHKGRIRVSSEPGAGTTFILELPLKQQDGEDAH
jgi:signal transduction histidine kinase